MSIYRERIPVKTIREVRERDVHCQYPLAEKYNPTRGLWEVVHSCKQRRYLQIDHLTPVCLSLEWGWGWDQINSSENLSLICKPHHLLKDKYMSSYKAQFLRQLGSSRTPSQTIKLGEHIFLGIPPRQYGNVVKYT